MIYGLGTVWRCDCCGEYHTLLIIDDYPRVIVLIDGVEVRPIGTFVVLITVARPCGSRRVGLSFLSRGK